MAPHGDSMPTTDSHSARGRGWCAAIWLGSIVVLVGAALRLAGFEEALIGADQTFILGPAAHMAAFRNLPLVSVKSSVGLWQPATQAYLAGVALLLVRQVSAVKWFYSLLDVVAIALLHHSVRRAWGGRAALVAAALYATNPWVLEYVRWIHWHSLVSTFAVVTFACYFILVSPTPTRKNWGWLALGMVAATLMGTVHVVALPWTLLLCLAGLWIAWHRRVWRGFLVGSVASFLVLLPYLVYLVQTSSLDLSSFLQLGAGAGTHWNTGAIGLTAELITGRSVFATPRTSLWADSVLQLPPLYDAFLCLVVLAFIGLAVRACVRRAERAAILMAIGWSFLPIALYLRSGVHVQHFYLHYLFPAPFVGLGMAIETAAGTRGTRRWQKVARTIAYLAIAASLAVALWWATQWAVRIGLEQQSLIGVPTRAWVMDDAVEKMERYLESEPECQIVIITRFEGEHSAFDWIPSFAGSDRIRVAPAGEGLIIPPGCTCYLLGLGASPSDLGSVEGQAVEQQEMAIPARPPWRFYCAQERAEIAQPTAEWENGLSLIDATIEGEVGTGATVTIASTWHYSEVAPREYHFFHHLFYEGQLVAQKDGPGVPSWYWRDDDVLEMRFQIALPEVMPGGEYPLRVGAYSWPDLRRVLLSDGSDSYELGRLTVP
jgi:hypothetical protein